MYKEIEVLIPFVSRADLNAASASSCDGMSVLIPFVSRADLNVSYLRYPVKFKRLNPFCFQG